MFCKKMIPIVSKLVTHMYETFDLFQLLSYKIEITASVLHLITVLKISYSFLKKLSYNGECDRKIHMKNESFCL